MIVKKIITGFVVQEFDTETKQFVSQEFISSDEADFEDEDGNRVHAFSEYLPMEMKQPKEIA